MDNSIENILTEVQRAHVSSGFRVSIPRRTSKMRKVEVFAWPQSEPVEAEFATPIVRQGDFSTEAISQALEEVYHSTIAVSFEVDSDSSDSVLESRPLTKLLDGSAATHIIDVIAKRLEVRHLHKWLRSVVPQAWLSVTSIELWLWVYTEEDMERYKEILIDKRLKHFLGSLHKLQKLSFRISSDIPWHNGLHLRSPFDVIGEDNYWPHLETLELECVKARVGEFLNFLKSHRSSLKTLTLRYFKARGSGFEMLHQIREVLNLERADVSGELKASDGCWKINIPEVDEDAELAGTLGRWLVKDLGGNIPLPKGGCR